MARITFYTQSGKCRFIFTALWYDGIDGPDSFNIF